MVQFGETAQGTTHAMTGRLMFDMDKLRLLSFRGKVHNELVRIRYRTSGPTSMFRYCPRDIEIQMTYKHDRGFDEVASIGTRMVVNRGKNDYGGVYWSTLFNIGNYDIGEGTSTRKEDIYNALSQRGNDEAFREHYKIVKPLPPKRPSSGSLNARAASEHSQSDISLHHAASSFVWGKGPKVLSTW